METADYYALVLKGLKNKGRPIPVNDLWIARHCNVVFYLTH
jgi:predicted nucleic acid-binding protein